MPLLWTLVLACVAGDSEATWAAYPPLPAARFLLAPESALVEPLVLSETG